MEKLMKMTIEELIEKGYEIDLGMFWFDTVGEAKEGYAQVLDKGAEIQSTTSSDGNTWLKAESGDEDVSLDVYHYVRKTDEPELVTQKLIL